MHQFHRPIRGPEPSGSNLRQAQDGICDRDTGAGGASAGSRQLPSYSNEQNVLKSGALLGCKGSVP